MRPTHIEHIGIAVKSLEDSIPLFESLLGTKCYAIEEVAEQKVRTAFLRCGQTKIELLEPTCPESTIATFIERNNGRGGMHHIAFAVEDLEGHLEEAQELGISLIDSTPRKGAEGLDIAFIHPKSTAGVLMELCSKANGNNQNK